MGHQALRETFTRLRRARPPLADYTAIELMIDREAMLILVRPGRPG